MTKRLEVKFIFMLEPDEFGLEHVLPAIKEWVQEQRSDPLVMNSMSDEVLDDQPPAKVATLARLRKPRADAGKPRGPKGQRTAAVVLDAVPQEV
jgi:hypothetical protein